MTQLEPDGPVFSVNINQRWQINDQSLLGKHKPTKHPSQTPMLSTTACKEIGSHSRQGAHNTHAGRSMREPSIGRGVPECSNKLSCTLGYLSESIQDIQIPDLAPIRKRRIKSLSNQGYWTVYRKGSQN